MKYRTKATKLKAAVNTVLAVHDFGESSDDRQACVLTATEDGLQLESAKLGAYCSTRVEGQLLREGAVGLNAKDVASMKLKGDVIVDADESTATFKDGKTAYRWAVDERAQQETEEQKGAAIQVKTMAKVPLAVLRAGATFATFTSEMKGDYDVQITIDDGYLEYCGIDYFGYGRYEFRNKAVKARERCHFILGNSILAKVLKEADKEGVASIGVSADGSLVRISSTGLSLWHPAVDKKYQDTADMIKTVTKGPDAKRVLQIVADRNELKTAVDNAAPVGKKSAEARMVLAIDKKKQPSIRQSAQDNVAVCRFAAQEVKCGGPVKIQLRANYLKEFLKVAPATVPLRVESWNQQFLRITVKEDPGLVDYMVAMATE